MFFFLPRLLRSFVGILLLIVCAPMLQSQTISSLVSVNPCRIIDTRDPQGPYGGPSLAGQASRDISIPGKSSCGIPSNALAYSLNVTVVPHGSLDYLTIWPTGQTMPLASTLNAPSGAVTANAAIVPAGAGGSVSVFVTSTVDLIMDINGYFAPQQLPAQQQIPTVINQSTSAGLLNTAIGIGTSSTAGAQNTAVGNSALAANLDGTLNTAVGAGALAAHSSGSENTAVGANTLANSSNGSFNTALGSHGLEFNTIGNGNTAIGYEALGSNTSGLNNTAIGRNALLAVTGGIENVGIGNEAGLLATGSDNIYIGHPGVAGESGVIRIGAPAGTPNGRVGGTVNGQNSIYIPAVRSNAVSGYSVFVDLSGKVGSMPSSRRYKEDIRDVGEVSDGILKLRPVQFRYKQPADDGTKPLQYGLIAEEVDAVYPQLVLRTKEGVIEGVQYQQLPALLLNEIQKQHKVISAQEETIQKLLLRVEALESVAQGQPAADRLR